MDLCHECERPLRYGSLKAEDRPGTVVHYGRGLCKPDWKRLHKAGVLDRLYPPAGVDVNGRSARDVSVPRDRAEPCESCGKNMRPPGTTRTDWPDTVIRKGRVCSGCSERRRKDPRPSSTSPADIRKMREDLKDWFRDNGRDWRLAGIPA